MAQVLPSLMYPRLCGVYPAPLIKRKGKEGQGKKWPKKHKGKGRSACACFKESRSSNWAMMSANRDLPSCSASSFRPYFSLCTTTWVSHCNAALAAENDIGPRLRGRKPAVAAVSCERLLFLQESAIFLRPENASFSGRRGEFVKICGFLWKSAF